MNCKNCNTDLHPYYQKKYDGYCLDCINARADEKDELIARMERQLAAAERLYQATHEHIHGYGSTEPILNALNDYANAKEQQ